MFLRPKKSPFKKKLLDFNNRINHIINSVWFWLNSTDRHLVTEKEHKNLI